MKSRIIPWTCFVCNRAGDLSIAGDVRASSQFIKRVHDGLSPECKSPELAVVEDGQVTTLLFVEGQAPPVQTRMSAAYPD